MFEIRVINEKISIEELKPLSAAFVGNLVKGVVDIEQRMIALGGQMHADEEALLLDQGSEQQNLWGINIRPHKPKNEWIEYDSMINIRPSVGNRTRGVDDEKTRKIIQEIVYELIEGS